MDKPILLVEDNPMDVDLTIRAFKRNHVANPIDVARDGEEALQWIGRWDNGERVPAVVLLDLQLPKVSGLDVLRQLKAHPVYRAIPLVVLTTSSEDRDVQTAYQLGANSYVVKPVSFDQFTQVTAQIDLYWTLLNRAPKLGTTP